MNIDERNAIIEANIGLARFLAARYAKTFPTVDDMLSIAHVALVEAAGIYDASRGYKLSTLLNKVLYNDIEHITRKKRVSAISLETPITQEDEPLTLADTIRDNGPSVDDAAIARINFKRGVSSLTPLEKDALMLYSAGYTQSEIGTARGVSQVQISRRLKKVRRKLGGAL